MASTFSSNKRLELPGYNDYIDTWNVPVNTDMSAIDVALGGSTLLNATSPTGTVTLTYTQYRPLSIIVSGSMSADVYYTIPAGVGGQWTVTNGTTGAFSVYMVSAAGGASVRISQGYTTVVSCDGSATGMRLSINTPVAASGSSGQVQYNLNGSFAGSNNLTFNGTTLSATGLSVAGTFSVNTISTSGTITSTNSITGASFITSGTINATSSITGGSLIAGSTISASGSITGGSFSTGGSINAGGKITGGTLATGGSVTAAGSIQANGAVLSGVSSFTPAYTGSAVQIAPQLFGSIFSKGTTGDTTQISFSNPNGQVGFINTIGSSTAYSTTSDYRLKTNVNPMTGALNVISALKPCTYEWKISGFGGEGFIAHELQQVIPHAVLGEKDAVNEDGSIKPQGVDYSKIVVHLVAAIQELTAKIEALEARG